MSPELAKCPTCGRPLPDTGLLADAVDSALLGTVADTVARAAAPTPTQPGGLSSGAAIAVRKPATPQPPE